MMVLIAWLALEMDSFEDNDKPSTPSSSSVASDLSMMIAEGELACVSAFCDIE